MNILILGSGGREHAIAWKVAQSSMCSQLFIAPGNPGTAQLGKNLPIAVNDFNAIHQACLEYHLDMVIVGPEDPLVQGIADYFSAHTELQHIHLIGPDAQAAQLEGSKAYAKVFMQEFGIPTAAYREFTAAQQTEAKDYIFEHTLPVVLKADGLAAGKGVVIAQTHEEAWQTFQEMTAERKFGAAGDIVVIEQFLHGIECSAFVLTDGENYMLLPEAKDYKRIGEGDTGLNTGGMGAISPVPFANEVFMQKVRERIVEPTMRGIRARKLNYKGFVFIGLIAVEGEPYVIEYNCRMGDPETEVVMPRLKSDLVELLLSLKDNSLASKQLEMDSKHAATVMVVSGGYPGDYAKGKPISGVDEIPEGLVFHAGTREENGQLLSHGGRVLACTVLRDSLQDAIRQARANAAQIAFDGAYFRRDIGWEFMPAVRN